MTFTRVEQELHDDFRSTNIPESDETDEKELFDSASESEDDSMMGPRITKDMNIFTHHLKQCVFEETLIRTLPGHALLLWSPMTVNYHKHLKRMCETNAKIWEDPAFAESSKIEQDKLSQKFRKMSTRTKLIWWDENEELTAPPRSQMKWKPHSIRLFFVCGVTGDHVYGHWMRNSQTARKREAEFCLKREFIPCGGKNNEAWFSTIPEHIRVMCRTKAKLVRTSWSQMSHHYYIVPPFPLVPCLYRSKQENGGKSAYGVWP